MFNVYGKSGCSACNQAVSLLNMKGEDHQYLSMGKDYDVQKFMSFNTSHKTFPLITQVVDGGEVYVGGLAELKEKLK